MELLKAPKTVYLKRFKESFKFKKNSNCFFFSPILFF